MATAVPPKVGMQKYLIQRAIGRGEFCDVYKALDQASRQKVAIKHLKISLMYDTQSRVDCLKEIELLCHLDHPNIIRHIESFYDNNELYIVLEYADAGDMSRMLDYFRKKGERISEQMIWLMFAQVCSGLAYMHRQRVMHRDIKPANILIYKDRTIKLADFGLSRLLSATTDNACSLVGTPYYMSPERLNQKMYTFKADIWSVGCLLYEMTKLHHPFYGNNLNLDMLRRRIEDLQYEPIEENGNYSYELTFVIKSCLKPEPEKRLDIHQIESIAKNMALKFNDNQGGGGGSTPTWQQSTYTDNNIVLHHSQSSS